MSKAQRQKFYASKAWENKREERLKIDNYECQECKRKGKYTPARAVHHKKHLEYYPELALDIDNLESLCDACHNKEHPEKLKKAKPKKQIHGERWK